jgi:hypothetical protein
MVEPVIPATVVKAEEKPVERKGLQGIRWSWKKLEDAEGTDDIQAVLAQVMQDAKSDVEVTLAIPAAVYIRIMGDAKMALYCGEIKEMSLEAYVYRSLQVMENNVKALFVKRKG